MNTLTEFKRPAIRYGQAQLFSSPWHPLGGWRCDGQSWTRVYGKSRCRRATVARRAVVRNVAGWWRWEVLEFSLKTRAERRVCARGVKGYLFAEMAWPFADLAARTAD